MPSASSNVQQHGFQERAEWGGSGPLRKRFAVQVREVGERTLRFVISTADLDRDGDTIAVEGWQLDNFRANPVVLFGHDYRSLPVARAINTRVENGSLVSEARFATAEEYPFADQVFRLYKGGFMRAVSVGFLPVEWKQAQGQERPYGIDFLKQELLEFSCVVVPSNPNALVAAGLGGRRGRGPASGVRPGGSGISEEERMLRDFEKRRQKKRDAYRREVGLVTAAPARSTGKAAAVTGGGVPSQDVGEIPDITSETLRSWFDQWGFEVTGRRIN